MMRTVRDAVHQLLLGEGIDRVFGNPGSTEMRFFRDFPGDLSYVMVPQEASVVAMADGWAQGAHRTGVAMVHSAAGLGHGLGNVFSAARNHTSMLVIAGQQTRSLLAHEPYLFARDAARFPQPYVKFGAEAARPQDTPALIAQALAIAATPPYGPTFVSVPEDDWDIEVEDWPATGVTADATLGASSVVRILEVLRSANRAALVVGAEVAIEGATETAVELVERTGADVWAAPVSSRSSFPEDHPRFAGFLPPVAAQVRGILEPYDVVLVAGAPVVTQHVPSEGSPVPVGTTLLQLTSNPEHASQAYGGERFVAPVGPSLRAICAELSVRPRIQEPARRQRPAMPDPRRGEGISPEFVLAMLAGMLPHDAVIVEEAPTHRNAIHEHLPIGAGQDYFVAASGGLGWAMPAAVGLGMATGRPVACLIGDGSSLYSPQALWTAAQHGVHVVYVVLDNGGYSAMKAFGRRLQVLSAPGLELPGVDLPTLAEGFGTPGVRIVEPDRVQHALRAALAADGPQLLDIIVGPAVGELY